MLAVLRLRKQLNRMVLRREGAGSRKTRVPVMAFDRWQMRCKCVAASSGADPVVPQPAASAPADPDLVADIVKAGCTAADAAAVAHELAGMSRREADSIASAPLSAAAHVVVQRHKHSIDVIFAHRGGSGGGRSGGGGGGGGESKVLKLNPTHYDKLRAMYRRASASSSSRSSSDDAGEEERFHCRLYAVLARYHGVQGHGFQAALGEDAFAALHAHFGVSLECFASPLNCRYAAHCSAYADTDRPFGSLGSFFDFHPVRGSFEANPPFEEVVMARCVEHIEALLRGASGAMSFVVVVPAWRDAEAWRALDASPFKRRVLVVARDEHGFCDGAAHQRRDRYRDSPYDTALFFLQNGEGAAQWPASDGALDAVRRAMALALPTVAMRKRQKRDGRGTHDEMRGTYKGKKSKANSAVGVRARKKAEGAEALRVRKRVKEREKKKRGKRRKYLAAHPDAVPRAEP